MDNDLLELTNAQKRVYIAEKMFENSSVNNITGYVLYDKCLDMSILKEALELAVASMDNLNIRLISNNGDIRQYFSNEKVKIQEYIFENEKELQRHLDIFAKQVFQLYNSSLIRIELFTINNMKCGYSINFHHLVSDGWTAKLFVEKVASIYENIINDTKNSIEKYEYADFIKSEKNYLHSTKAEKHRDMLLSEIGKYKNISNYSIGYNNAKGQRYSKVLTSKENKQIKDLIADGISISQLFAAIFNLIIFFSDGKVPPFLSIPVYNRINKLEKLTGGMFTSTMLIGANLNKHTTLAEVLAITGSSLRKAMKYQRFPFNELYNDIKKQQPDVNELYYFSVNCYNMNLDTKINGINGKYFELYQGSQSVPLQCIYKTWNQTETIIAIDYREDCFQKQDVENIYKFIFDVINAYKLNPKMTINEFSASIRQNELKEQKNRVLYLEDQNKKTLSEQLETIFKNDGNKTAIYRSDKVVSYQELREYLANTIIELKKYDLCNGKTIILIMENSLNYVVYALASLIVRSAIVPLDVSVSEERLQSIINNCKANAIISSRDCLKYSDITWIKPDIKKHSYTNFDIIFENYKDDKNNQSDLAYIIYTSGTTGKPKGVQIKRESIANYLSWAEILYCNSESVFYMHSSPAFDLSITTLLLPYTSGSAVVIDELNSNIHEMTNSQFASKINIVKATPSQLELLLAQKLDYVSINVIISGGEELTVNLAEKLTNKFGEQLHIYNEYGPTEATIGCMSYIYSHKDYTIKQAVPIGVATPGTEIILVKDGRSVYGHEIGEMYISGIQLSSGYKGLTEKNNESFVKMDFYDEILYKTGDLAYWNEDWQLEFLGRKQNQNKVNGFRIETNSLENVIKNLDGVSNCIVQVDKTSSMDYIIAIVQTNSVSKADIREQIGRYLPNYYMPHYIFIVNNIPLTQSGKIDYSYIQQLKLDVQKNNIQENITTEKVIELIYNTCEEVLHSGIAMNEYNYFVAGGDSIKALLIIAKLQDYGIELALADILMYPDINEMITKVSMITAIDNTKAFLPSEFMLPDNMTYLKSDVPCFEEYIQHLSLECNIVYSNERIIKAWNELFDYFPILKYNYKNGKLSIPQEKSSQSLRFVYLENATSDNTPSTLEKHKQEKLIELSVVLDKKGLVFDFRLHHVIADGYSWKTILEVFGKLLNQEKINRIINCNYNEFATETIYRCFNTKKLMEYSDYFCIKKEVSVEMISASERKYTIIDNMLNIIDTYPGFFRTQLLVEWDAREMQKFKKYGNTIGCFSVFFPMSKGNESTSIIKEYLCSDTIELNRNINVIRLNYLGELSKIIPDGFKINDDSFENSLRQCGAFGCEAEVTMYIQNEQLYMYFSSRLSNKKKLEGFATKLKEAINDIQIDDLIDLSEEDLDVIFD